MIKHIVRGVHKRLPASVRKRLGEDEHSLELLEGSAGAFIMRFLSFLTTYAFTIAVARMYGADALGIFSLGATVLLLAAIVGKLGLDVALVRLVAKHLAQGTPSIAKRHYLSALAIATPVGLSLSAALYLLRNHIATTLFGKPELAPTLAAIAIAITPAILLYIVTECIRGQKKPSLYVLLHPTGVMHFGIALLAIITITANPNVLPVIGYTVGIIVALIIALWTWHRSMLHVPAAARADAPATTLTRIALPMMLSSSAFFLMNIADTILLGLWRTPAEVGIYNAALRLSMITAFSLTTFNLVVAPSFSALHATGDLRQLKATIKKVTALIFWTSLPVLTILTIFPGTILSIFGNEFTAGSGALLILLAGQFVNAACGSVGTLLNMTGHHDAFMRIIFAALTLNVILNVLLIPTYGIIGAAIAASASTIAWNLACVVYIYRKFGIVTLYSPTYKQENKKN